MAACSDADVRRALSTVAVRCADGALLSQLAQAAQQHGLTAKALATRYSAFTINRRARAARCKRRGRALRGGGSTAAPFETRADASALRTRTTPRRRPWPRSDDESKANKVTPALVEAFLSQLQRDASSGARAAAPRGGGAGGQWGARSWEE